MSCFVWLYWADTAGAELKSQISGTEAPNCPCSAHKHTCTGRRARAHTHTRTDGGERGGDSENSLVSLGPHPSSTHPPSAVPTGPLTSYWPCSLIIRSAWNTLGHSNPFCMHKHTRPHTPRTHWLLWEQYFGPTAPWQPYPQTHTV